MIKVHNVIPLNEIFKEGSSRIFNIGSKSSKSHTPNLYYGELHRNDFLEKKTSLFFPEESNQYTFTYMMKGSLLLDSGNEKHYLNPGDLYLSKSDAENSYLNEYEILDSPATLVQLRLPIEFNLNCFEQNRKIIHEKNIAHYRDPIKDYKQLFSAILDSKESFYIWYISVVPSGRMHVPIPLSGRSFVFILNGKMQLGEAGKPIPQFNLISLDTPKSGNELDVINCSGSSRLEFLVLGGSRY
jgi:hypothetical protein